MATQTEIQLEPIIASPPRTYLKGHGIDAGPTPFNANEEISNVPPNPEQLELQDSDDHPEASTAYATPNVRAVKGKLFSIYFAVFIAGMNDGAVGTLIPYLQPSYNVGLLQVAILYLINFAGWMLAAFSNVHVTSWIGQGGLLVFGAICQMLAYVLIFWKPPFGLFAASFFFSGLGMAYQDAQANAFAANVENAYRWLGVLHAAYGLGALIAPLIATTIAAATPYWNYYYCIMLGVAAFNVAFLATAFRKGLFRPVSRTAKQTAGSDLKKALSQKSVWILSLYFLFYVGAEVTSGGWVVQFLVSVRGGYPGEVGYVASGFWGGLTLGRLLLADPVNRFGERRSVLVLIACALGMQFLFWFVPNIVADAIFISVLGFCIAPFFPVGISVVTKILPRELHVAAVGFAATAGQAGSAAFPFMTGAIASVKGVQTLQPIMVALLAGMFLLWSILPRVKKPSQ